MFALRERRVHVTQVRRRASACVWGEGAKAPHHLYQEGTGTGTHHYTAHKMQTHTQRHALQEDFEMAVAKVKKAGDDKNMSLKKVCV